MHTKHWIPLTAHQFASPTPPPFDLDAKCRSCGDPVHSPRHRTELIGAAVIDFLQSQGDGSVETKAVIMLADGGLVVRSMIGHTSGAQLIAAPLPGVDVTPDVFDESPILPPPPRPRTRRKAR